MYISSTVLEVLPFEVVGTETAGGSYEITCRVEEVVDLPGVATVQWLGPMGQQLPGNDPDIVIEGPNILVLKLIFTTLRARHQDVYTCLGESSTSEGVPVMETRTITVTPSEQT